MTTKLFDEVNENPIEFSIMANAHAFSVLSKSLYSKPYHAVVREVVANAVDAHKAAGITDVKVRVTHEAGCFNVRDYGHGLAPSDLEVLYTTYFSTTKTAGDQFTGSFGLGAKSPFAISEEFTVKTYWFGVCHEYKAFICPETGMPKIQCVRVDPHCVGESGLEVIVPVNNGAIYTAADEVLPYFAEYVDYSRQLNNPVTSNTTQIGPCSVRHATDHKQIIIVMGHVPYEVNFDLVGYKYFEDIPRGGVYYAEVGPGTIDVTPSREEIHYTTKSKECIKRLALDIAESMAIERERLLKGLSLRELYEQYDSLRSTGLGQILFPHRGGFLFEGKKLEIKSSIPLDYVFDVIEVTSSSIFKKRSAYSLSRDTVHRSIFVKSKVSKPQVERAKDLLLEQNINFIYFEENSYPAHEREHRLKKIRETWPHLVLREEENLKSFYPKTTPSAPGIRRPRSKFTWNILNKKGQWSRVEKPSEEPAVVVLMNDKDSFDFDYEGSTYTIQNKRLPPFLWLNNQSVRLYGVSSKAGLQSEEAKAMWAFPEFCDLKAQELANSVQENGMTLDNSIMVEMLETLQIIKRIPYTSNLVEARSYTQERNLSLYSSLAALMTWKELAKLESALTPVDALLEKDFPLAELLSTSFRYYRPGSKNFKAVKDYFDAILAAKGW